MITNNITGLILSAGKSGRMGKFKPLINYKDKSFLKNVIINLDPVCDKIIIVTGFNSTELKEKIVEQFENNKELIIKDKLLFVENPVFEKGMFTSLQKGLSQAIDADWVLYHFVDQPGLPKDFYLDFIGQIDSVSNWIQPSYNNRNGHPILIKNELFEIILKPDENSNLREISREPVVRKKLWECYYQNVLQDIDTEEDYKASLDDDFV